MPAHRRHHDHEAGPRSGTRFVTRAQLRIDWTTRSASLLVATVSDGERTTCCARRTKALGPSRVRGAQTWIWIRRADQIPMRNRDEIKRSIGLGPEVGGP
jgi:hypothetical protein